MRGRSYYILVADYQRGAPAAAELRIAATLARGGQRWHQITNLPRGGVSRHAFASLGVDMFVIGGQERLQGILEARPSQSSRVSVIRLPDFSPML